MVKRPLAFITVFFAIGILAAVFEVNTVILSSVIILSALTTFFFQKSLLPLMLALVLSLFGGVARMEVMQNHRDSIVREFNSQTLFLTMTVTDFSDEGKCIAEFSKDSKTHKIYLRVKDGSTFYPGDIIKAEVTLREPYSSKISVSDFSTYLSGRNIYLYAYTDSADIAGQHTKGIKGAVYSLRRYIDEIGGKHFTGDTCALFNAMVLGDKRLISDELSVALQKAGLNHIAVVSGMHLSIIIAVQMMLLGRLFGRRRIGNIISIAGAVFITLLTGAGASVVRACIMCVIYQISQLCYRESDSVTSLMLAVLVILGFNPYLIFNAGFILSVASVLGILLFNPRVSEKVGKIIGGPVGEAASLCISAQLMVTVPVIYYFGIITPYALCSNVAVTVFASALVICGMLFSVVAAVPVLAGITDFLVRFFAKAIIVVCDFTEKLPGAVREMGELNLPFLSAWVFLLVMIYVRPKTAALCAKISAVFATAFLISVLCSAHSSGMTKINFIPYGSESMTAVFLPDGEAIMIDCPNRYDALTLTENHGRNAYNYAVMTSAGKGELPELAENGGVECIIALASMFDDVEMEDLEKEFKKFSVQTVFLQENESFSCKNARIRFITFEAAGTERAAVEIEYNGKHFVTLQSFDNKQLQALVEQNPHIFCDYLKLPFASVADKKELYNITRGKILRNKKQITINFN